MKKAIRCTLATLSKAINALESYEKSLESKNQRLLHEVADAISGEASARFDAAQYDGNYSVVMKTEFYGDSRSYVVAEGDKVAFIEFGTGGKYPDIHPNATEPWMEHSSWSLGAYGKGHWDSPHGWFFESEDGKYEHTYGNPANMCLYYSVRSVERKIPDIAKEVFGK